MIDISKINYALLDRPAVSNVLFHPRPEYARKESEKDDSLLMIPVEEDIRIGARFHIVENSGPNILFFHGNGEIVAGDVRFALGQRLVRAGQVGRAANEIWNPLGESGQHRSGRSPGGNGRPHFKGRQVSVPTVAEISI